MSAAVGWPDFLDAILIHREGDLLRGVYHEYNVVLPVQAAGPR